jgi:hypothetical protein
MPVRPPTMSSAYHLEEGWSGDIASPHHGQLHVADPGIVAPRRLGMKEVGHAIVTEAPEGPACGQIFAVSSTHLADLASPSATVADTGSLMTKVALSHFSLSPWNGRPLGK